VRFWGHKRETEKEKHGAPASIHLIKRPQVQKKQTNMHECKSTHTHTHTQVHAMPSGGQCKVSSSLSTCFLYKKLSIFNTSSLMQHDFLV